MPRLSPRAHRRLVLAALLLASAASIATSKAYSTSLEAHAHAHAPDASPEIAFELFANAAALEQTEESALELVFETDGESGAPAGGVVAEWSETGEVAGSAPAGQPSLRVEAWHGGCALDELGDCRRTLRVLASRAYDLELHAVFVDPPDDEGDGVPYPDAARLEIRSLE